jgi:hypothetical protein
VAEFLSVPFKFAISVQFILEFIPSVWISIVVYPNSKYVIDLSSIKYEVVLVFRQNFLPFELGKEQSRIDTGTWCAHCCAYLLQPPGIPEFKYIVFHYYFQ